MLKVNSSKQKLHEHLHLADVDKEYFKVCFSADNPSPALGLQPCVTVSPSHITAVEGSALCHVYRVVPSHDFEEMWNLPGSLNPRDRNQGEGWYKSVGRPIPPQIGGKGHREKGHTALTHGGSQAQL